MQLQSYKSLKKGYTLVELLIGITIISIVFIIGYAGFRDFSRRQALTGVSKQIKADLRLIQQLSSTGQKPTEEQGSCTQLSGYTFKIESASQYSLTANCSNANRLIKTVDLDSNVTLLPNLSSVQFKVLGQGTNLAADYTIYLSHISGASGTIVVGTGGEISSDSTVNPTSTPTGTPTPTPSSTPTGTPTPTPTGSCLPAGSFCWGNDSLCCSNDCGFFTCN